MYRNFVNFYIINAARVRAFLLFAFRPFPYISFLIPRLSSLSLSPIVVTTYLIIFTFVVIIARLLVFCFVFFLFFLASFYKYNQYILMRIKCFTSASSSLFFL